MKKQQIITLSILASSTIFVILVWLLGITAALEQRFYDYKFIVRGPVEPSQDIVIVGIDEESLERFGQFPWPRNILAQGIRNLKKAGVKVVAVDIIFPEPSRNPGADTALADALRYAKCVIGASHYDMVPSKVVEMVDDKPVFKEELKTVLTLPIKKFADSFKVIGFTNAAPDDDGVLRTAILHKTIEDVQYYSLNVHSAANFLDKKPEDFKFKSERLLANYRSGNGTYTRYSFRLIYDGKFPKEWIKDKIVFIGSLATGAFDHYPIPFEKVFPGVEFHTTVVDNLISNDYIRPSSPILVLIMILLFGLGFGYVFNRTKPLTGSLIFVVILVLYFVIVQLLFSKYYIHLDFFKPSLASVISFLGVMAYKFSSERKEKLWIKKTFSTYMSPDVIKELTENPDKLKLGGDKRTMSVLFSDIRGFTSICEKLTPEEIIHLLNEYLTAMVEIVFQYKGTVDKFIGDAVMAFWGAPVRQEDHALRAVGCALAMITKLRELQEKWKSEGKTIIDIGVGVNSGEMVVGNMGSNQRMDYTILGDNVNLGSRLEGLTRQYNVMVIISEYTYEMIKDHVEVNYLGEVKVKGKQKPVKVYEAIKIKQ
jgi:adenylate cyclase